MNKLDEAIKEVEDLRKDSADVLHWPYSDVVAAARAYSELLKHAPQIGALVYRGDKLGENWWAADADDIGMFSAAACNARPTLKAIHDNLTKWSD